MTRRCYFHSLKMKNLSSEQEKHLRRELYALQNFGVCYDTSTTGAGKTIVSLKLVKELRVSAVVVGPPTLRENWAREAGEEGVQIRFVSFAMMLKLKDLRHGEEMIIVDESHALKNASQTTKNFLDSRQSQFKYVLFLSATPFDHPRQADIFKRLIGKSIDVGEVMSSIKFSHNSAVHSFLCFVEQSEEDSKLYAKGKFLIGNANRTLDAGEEKNNFNPVAFNAGMKKIHDSLLAPLVSLIKESSKRCKIIVCIKFEDHFEAVKSHFQNENVLVLNGSTSMASRDQLISKFQRPDWEYRILLLSAAVGGIGIDLDDQNGKFPRRIFALPLFMSEYIQLVGRVQRRNTKSDAKVFVVQPRRKKTYFRSQMEVKGKVLESFGRKLEFKKKWSHADDCDAPKFASCLRKKFGRDIGGIITHMSCSCSSLFK